MIQITHRLEMRDNTPTIVFYAYTPVDYEFATDFDEIRQNAQATVLGIRDYALKHFFNLHNTMAMVIVNGVIIGTTTIANLLAKRWKSNKKSGGPH